MLNIKGNSGLSTCWRKSSISWGIAASPCLRAWRAARCNASLASRVRPLSARSIPSRMRTDASSGKRRAASSAYVNASSGRVCSNSLATDARSRPSSGRNAIARASNSAPNCRQASSFLRGAAGAPRP